MELTLKQENRIIRGGIIVFWCLFWLFNVIDKVIGQNIFLWVGKDRLTQFVAHFASIGIENVLVAKLTLIFVSAVEFIAFFFLALALWEFIKKREERTRFYLFWGILTSLFIMSLFAIGDQIFGERAELLEHATYWIAFVLSWFVYTKAN